MAVSQDTVYGAFRRSASHYPDNDFLCVLPQTAVKYSIEPRCYSYADTVREVEELAGRYRAAGLGFGHRVGLMLENRPAFFFHWLALNAIGASVVPLNPEWRRAELEYLVGHSELCVAVVPSERVEELRRAGAAAGRAIVVTAPDLDSLAETRVPAVLVKAPPGLDMECALLYTSGTTGRPKGCVLPNEYFLWAGRWYADIGGLCGVVPGADRLITPLPMSHMNAMAYSTMVMLLTGGCVVPLDRFHPQTWWDSVRESRATIIHYLGVMPAMLLGAAANDSDQGHSVRFGFGAGVSPRLHAPFEQRFGFPLLEAWAMTETGAGAVVIANREPRKVGTACFGAPEARIEYRIIDEQGGDAPPGQPGELLVRCAGPAPRSGFFREYLKDPAATAEAWAGGYFHTGDIVSVDADGDLHFIDRKKNVIRRSGENISAVEVESVLLQHPAIASVGVTAVPDEVRGDEVMACVVTRTALSESGRAAFAYEVLDFCLERLAYFKAPGYIGFCEWLPLTATEKIQRAQLKELGRNLLATAACIDVRALKKRIAIV
ncbi:MAG: ATP-dependent acyl-CoA ligase [Gammaproteobacteria bacterium]|nr:ATP-dependent acyl-CoA ligase [Gammaproteobacteria bacterium]